MSALDYGIEIECLVPANNAGTPMTAHRLAELITVAGVGCYYAGYSHATSNQWKIVTDGSLRAGPNQLALELVSPPLNESHLDQITKVCGVLAALGATVNRSCGLHVHVSARRLPINALKKLALLYIDHEPAIDSLLPASRRGSNNGYCRTMVNTSKSALMRARDVPGINTAVVGQRDGRYGKVNFAAYWRHGTVEFRHHSGTIDPVKIIKWIVLCNALVATAVKEADVAVVSEPSAPAPALATLFDPSNHMYWRRGGRRRRALFRLLTRPQGVTRSELAVELGLRSLPLIARHLQACGADARPEGRRNGHDVYRLRPTPVATPAPAYELPPVVTPTVPTTLEGLCARLELSEEDKAYWHARAAQFTPTGMPRAENMEAA